jgi:hypothetical protein
MKTASAKYIRREVMHMTVIIMNAIGLLIAFGDFVIALLTFLDKRNKRKK